MQATSKENQGGGVTQDIEGLNHQIAGHDIVNHYKVEQKPKTLDECSPDELRNERDWSRKLIKEANQNIRTSWPVRVLPFTLLLAALIIYLFWPEHFFVIMLAPITLILQLNFFMQVNEAEFKVIQRHKKVINYVYERLRDFGIDER